jgi:hypothetical protein
MLGLGFVALLGVDSGNVEDAKATTLYDQYNKEIYFDSLQTDVANDTATSTETTRWFPLVYGNGMANHPTAICYWNVTAFADSDAVKLFFEASSKPAPSESSPTEYERYQVYLPGGGYAANITLWQGVDDDCMIVSPAADATNQTRPSGVKATYGRFRVTNLDDYTGSFRMDVLLVGD